MSSVIVIRSEFTFLIVFLLVSLYFFSIVFVFLFCVCMWDCIFVYLFYFVFFLPPISEYKPKNIFMELFVERGGWGTSCYY